MSEHLRRWLAAAGKGDTATIAAFLRKGQDVNAADGEGLTALHNASNEGRVAVIKLLLTSGANVEAKSKARLQLRFCCMPAVAPSCGATSSCGAAPHA